MNTPPLIAYYSYSGITKALAEDIALITDGELLELIPQKPYSFSYNTAVKEIRQEIEREYCPPLSNCFDSVAVYDTIFIGSPNWLKTFAPPIRSFLRSVDLTGKTIIPFCTHGGGGFGHMVEDLQHECSNCLLKEDIALKGNYDFEEVQKWIISL